MTRRAILRPLIVKILEESDKPLRFVEIRTKLEEELSRKRLDDKQLSSNLLEMQEQGVLEKRILDGRPKYSLTYSHYEQALTRALTEILNRRKPSEVHADLSDEKLPPHIVFVSPPSYDYETKKAIEEKTLRRNSLTYGGGPMKRIGESRYVPNWDSPASAISSVLLNDFHGLLEPHQQKGIIELIRWAYWLGCRCLIEGNDMGPSFSLDSLISKNKSFAQACIEKFKNDHNRVDLEHTLIRILDLTEELANKENLAEFLSYYYEKFDEYTHFLKRLTMLEEGFVGGGERQFSEFGDFHALVVSGLWRARLLHLNPSFALRSFEETLFLTSGKVWSEFMESIITMKRFCSPAELKEDSNLREIVGGSQVSVKKVRELQRYLKPLTELSRKRQILIAYLWGFSQTTDLSKKSFIPIFEDWLDALEKGRLDNERLIFEEGIESVARSIRAIKRGKSPPPLLLDLQPWNTRDVFEHYPQGKDQRFWENLLKLMRGRMNFRNTT